MRHDFLREREWLTLEFDGEIGTGQFEAELQNIFGAAGYEEATAYRLDPDLSDMDSYDFLIEDVSQLKYGDYNGLCCVIDFRDIGYTILTDNDYYWQICSDVSSLSRYLLAIGHSGPIELLEKTRNSILPYVSNQKSHAADSSAELMKEISSSFKRWTAVL